MAYNYGHSTSNANSGHIFIKPDARTAWSRTLDHHTEEAAKTSGGEMPEFDPGSGQFDLESEYEFNKRTKPLTVQQYTEVVRSICNAQGFKYALQFNETTGEISSIVYGARADLVSRQTCNAERMPTLGQTESGLFQRFETLQSRAKES